MLWHIDVEILLVYPTDCAVNRELPRLLCVKKTQTRKNCQLNKYCLPSSWEFTALPLDHLGLILYCIDCPLRFSDLPPALLIIIYVWHWNIAISSKKMYDVLHPKNMLILVVKNFGEGCKIIFSPKVNTCEGNHDNFWKGVPSRQQLNLEFLSLNTVSRDSFFFDIISFLLLTSGTDNITDGTHLSGIYYSVYGFHLQLLRLVNNWVESIYKTQKL